MDRQQIAELHEKAAEHYLRGEFEDAFEAWKTVLAIDPGDEQALEGARLSSMLNEVPEPASSAIPPHVEPAELRRRLDEVDAHLEAGDLNGAVDVAETLASELPSDPAVLEARDRARQALEQEPFLRRQLAQAKAELAAGRPMAAAAACNAVLSIDPHHFEAADLLRQCEETPEGGDSLDMDLKVLDALSTHLDGADLAGEPPPLPSPAPEAVGVAQPLATPPPPARDAAAEELRRRVADLLEEANREAAAGRIDEALGILSRVFILDEQNAKAQQLEQELRAAQGKSSRDADTWLQEAVQDFDAGRLEKARELFQKVLGRYPSHLEALDYLERIDSAQAAQERGAAGAGAPQEFHGQDLLAAGCSFEGGGGTGSGPRTMVAEPDTLAIPLERAAGRPENAPQAPAEQSWNLADAGMEGRSPAVPNVAPPSARSSLSWPLVAGLIALVFVGVAAVIAWKLPGLLGLGKARPAPSATVEGKPARAPAPRGNSPAPDPVNRITAKNAPEAMARAQAAMDSGAYAEAVIAYNEALTIDPALDAARVGLANAGERYKIQKTERDQIDRVKAAFAEGEYTPALKILYRLPEGKYAEEVERYKVNAWYNLGLISLRAGNCKEAQENFDEALAIRSGETDVRRAKALAQKYQAAVKDRGFYDTVEAIPFRKFDE
jgi:tetratricopeptide (TPR) repeat protein